MTDELQPIVGLNTRAWWTPDGPHPKHLPVPLGLAKIGDPSQSYGEATSIRVPDPNNFDRDVEIGTVEAGEERATLSIMMRYVTDPATLMRYARRRCKNMLYAVIGKCGNPNDFVFGGAKIVVFPGVDFSTYGIENFGAFDKDESEPSNETADITSKYFCELLPETFSEVAEDESVREIWTITRVDEQSCGNCGKSSDGCQRFIATMAGTGATPGTSPSILYTADGGATWSSKDIDTMYSLETVKGAAYIGGYFVIVTDQGELHWIDVDKLYRGTGTWSQTDQGFIAGGEPSGGHIHMFSVDPRHTWIVGDGGYIYFTSNPPAGVTVQDDGVATAQNLMSVHFFNKYYGVAVGELNAVVFTQNGGKTWQAVTGPAPGITMNTVWMLGRELWLVGASNGTLYITENAGASWETAAAAGMEMPATVTEIDHIKFVNEYEGYMAAQVGANGRLLRTVTAGAIWTILPDTKDGVDIPANDYLNEVAPCDTCDNLVMAAGLGDDASEGVIVKAANYTPDEETI